MVFPGFTRQEQRVEDHLKHAGGLRRRDPDVASLAAGGFGEDAAAVGASRTSWRPPYRFTGSLPGDTTSHRAGVPGKAAVSWGGGEAESQAASHSPARAGSPAGVLGAHTRQSPASGPAGGDQVAPDKSVCRAQEGSHTPSRGIGQGDSGSRSTPPACSDVPGPRDSARPRSASPSGKAVNGPLALDKVKAVPRAAF